MSPQKGASAQKDAAKEAAAEARREAHKAVPMCEVCGNEYDKAFEITMPDGSKHTFDSFECAIHAVAPLCAHCGCRIVGHGVESNGSYYCCASCAHIVGVRGLKDRA